MAGMDDDIEDHADEGILDPEDTLDDRDELAEGYSPPERPRATEEWGTTARETAEGEGWSGRLAREVPDVADEEGDGLGDSDDTDGELIDDEVGDVRAGRLVATDEGYGERQRRRAVRRRTRASTAARRRRRKRPST